MFLKELGKGVFSALVLVPVTIIGVCTAGYLWDKKIKPRLDKMEK